MRIAALVLALACGQDAPEERLRKLAADLASEDFEVREKASQEFIRLGRPALPAARKLLESPDAEVKARAAGIVRAIEAALRAKALVLEVSADKKAYKPGEKISLEARLKNVEDFPVVALKFIWDGGLTPSSWISVSAGDKPLNTAGDALPQVFVHRIMDETRFLTVKAGESAVIRSATVTGIWDLGGKEPGLKASYAGGRVVPLKAGRYKVKAVYKFEFDAARALKAADPDPFFGELAWSFKGNSKALLQRAWTGSLEAEAEFEVIER